METKKSKITQTSAELIKTILSKIFDKEAAITSSMDGTVKQIHLHVTRDITKIDINNLAVIGRDYTFQRSGSGITVKFQNY
jgi:hypothetical protein